jgi:hypothetical protein
MKEEQVVTCNDRMTGKAAKRAAARRVAATNRHFRCLSSLKYLNILVPQSLKLTVWRSRQEGDLFTDKLLVSRISLIAH